MGLDMLLAAYTPYILFGLANILICLMWGFRMEGRINIIDQRHIDLKELIGSRLTDIDGRLGRIERSLNGTLRHD